MPDERRWLVILEAITYIWAAAIEEVLVCCHQENFPFKTIFA